MPEASGQLDESRKWPEAADAILASMVAAAEYELAMSFGQHAEEVAERIDPGEVARAWEVVRDGQT